MNRNDLLRRIQVRGRDIIDEFFPSDANADLDSLIGDRRHEVDPEAYRMFVAVRTLLRESGMPGCEAGQIMALLNSRAA